ncbi:MAG TPA: thioesterase family protein, partial [Hyphomicrobiaceae bacterium]|nr:thioesterase family protein [Hyphomicrobiaceae bacterium]
MKPTLAPGAKITFRYLVPDNKTVPHLYPESPDFQAMPAVFATGFMVGLIEWACMELLKPYLDPGEASLGVHIEVSHVAATLPGQTVTVEAECTRLEGRRVVFRVKAHDGMDAIGEGRHERIILPWDRFKARINAKAKAAGVP